MKAIIFDFDGVIYDSFDFHWGKIREFTGVDLSEQDFKNIHMGNFFESTPDEIKDVNWENYRDYIYNEQSNFKIEKEIKDAITKLNENYQLYIVSSGGTKNICDCLKNNQMDSLFREVLGLERYRSKIDKFNYIFDKYNLSSDDCFFVTDTLGDALEAKKVGIKTIAVDFGYHDREILEKGDPYLIISQMGELLELSN